MTKPQQAGGISHIKVPPPPETPEAPRVSIHDPKEMETRMLEQHHTHFLLAEGMVFTQEPLQTLINNNFTSAFTQHVLNGTAELDTLPINEYTKDLLRNLKF